jgi:hypothetical protein
MKIFDKITDLYYEVPYDWRPENIWYSFKCRFWKKYTTIKPRYLSHKWTDRCELMPHMIFEILSQFIEKECCPPEIVDWKASGHMVVVNGKEVNIRDEMQYLYDWWHKQYNVEYAQKQNELWEDVFNNIPRTSKGVNWKWKFETQEQADNYHEISNIAHEYDSFIEKTLHENLHRVVNIIPYLWT